MMFLSVFLGALFGGAFAEDWGTGALFGAVLGAIFARSLAVKARLRSLELKVQALELKSAHVSENAAAPLAQEEVAEPSPAFQPEQPAETSVPDESGLTLAEKEPLLARRPLASEADSIDSGAAMPEEPAVAEPEPNINYHPEPNPIVARVIGYFTGGNPAVRIGIIVLFFGVAFLLKYAAERDIFPIELRLIGVALAGVALLLVGWRLRDRGGEYGLVLQGGGIGLIYTTVFVALKLYSLLPPIAALLVMVTLVGFAALLAILQNARALAILSMVGGFLAPILASNNTGNHVLLFSYYAVLNAGIVLIAWKKSWRILNFIGFVFTFVIGSLWGHNAYRPELFASTEPFLLLSFVFYSVIGILFALHKRDAPRDYIDATLVFGTPIIVFALQSRLVQHIEYGLAFSALGFSLFYLLAARLVWGRFAEGTRMLVEAFVALGVVFATLAIPLAFDARWTSAAWAVEGAGIVWIGARQNRWLARLLGTALQFAAGIAFVIGGSRSAGELAILNSFYLGCATISLAGFVAAFHVRRQSMPTQYDGILSGLLLIWAIGWWLGAGLTEIESHVIPPYRIAAILGFMTASATAFMILALRLDWRELRYPAWGLLIVLLLSATMASEALLHPLQYGGYIAWPLAFAAYYWILHRSENDYPILKIAHFGALWLLIGLLAWQLGWTVSYLLGGNQTWALAMWGLVPALAVFAILAASRHAAWPIGAHREDYTTLALWPILGYLAIWSVASNLNSTGDPFPLPYIPFINPLDLAQFGGLVALLRWARSLAVDTGALRQRNQMLGGLALIAFVWLSAVLVRTLHHWNGVELSFDAIMASTLVQAALAIFWSLLAFALMFIATRKELRAVWIGGAALLAVVVVKLFAIDLSNSGTVERIVTFLAVGLLLVVVGYVAPVPPRQSAR